MRKLIFVVLLVAIAFLNIYPVSSAPTVNWTIEGDKVYINDSKVYISANPHTLTQPSGWITFNISTKTYTGNVDIAFGFNNSTVSKPKNAELYNPQTVQLPNVTSSKTFYNVTSIETTTDSPEYGNEYNTYKRKINYSIITGYNATNITIWGNKIVVVAFDSCIKESSGSCLPFESNKNYTITWNTTRTQNVDWSNIANKFNSITWDYDGFNIWYYATNLQVTAGNYYTVRVWMDTKINTAGKYGFAVKPSSQTLQQAKDAGTLYYLDPWWNNSYYESPLLINNTGNASILTDFQVLVNVTYNSAYMDANFTSFHLVNKTSNTEMIGRFWIDRSISVNGSHANIWLNLTSIPASAHDNTTFALAHRTVTEVDGSNGTGTFPIFNSGNTLTGWNYSGATIIAGKVNIAAGASNYFAFPMAISKPAILEFYANRLTVSGNYNVLGFINVNSSTLTWGNPALFFYHATDTWKSVSLTTTQTTIGAVDENYHWYKLIWGNTIGKTKFYEDGVQINTPASGFPASTQLYVSFGGQATVTGSELNVGNITVRKTTGLVDPTVQLGVTESPPSITSNTTYRTFEATWNILVNVTWYFNGTVVQTNNSVTSAKFSNSTNVTGLHNITASGVNVAGDASITWLWRIGIPEAGEAIREVISVIIS